MKKGMSYNEIAEMLIKIAEALQTMEENDDTDVEDTAKPYSKPISSSKTSTNEPKRKATTGHLTREQLDAMAFNDLKKLAVDMGVKPVGKRDTITDAILAVEAESDDNTSDINSKPSAKPVNTKGGLKVPSKEQAEEEQSEETDELFETVNAYSDADLKEVLKSIGISAVGKHEALVDKVIKAINEGKISNPLEDAETEDDEEETVEGDDGEDTLVDVFPQFSVNYAENISDARCEAIKGVHEEVVESDNSFDEGELDELISGFLGEEYDPNEFVIGDKVSLYAEIRKLYIDDEGIEHEDGDPYHLNGENYCCGAELMYNKKIKKYVCGSCGNKYDAN